MVSTYQRKKLTVVCSILNRSYNPYKDRCGQRDRVEDERGGGGGEGRGDEASNRAYRVVS